MTNHLTERDIKRAFILLEGGANNAEIGRAIGVTREAVRQLWTRESELYSEVVDKRTAREQA